MLTLAILFSQGRIARGIKRKKFIFVIALVTQFLPCRGKLKVFFRILVRPFLVFALLSLFFVFWRRVDRTGLGINIALALLLSFFLSIT